MTRKVRYGQSSLAAYVPGLCSSPVDQHLVRPRSSPEGHRGIELTMFPPQDEVLGEIEGDLDEDEEEFVFEEEDSDIPDEPLSPIDGFLESMFEIPPSFGVLYPSAPYAKPMPRTHADSAVLRTQSGFTGYRGARDRFLIPPAESASWDPSLSPPGSAPQEPEQETYGKFPESFEYGGGYEGKALALLGLVLLYRMATSGEGE